MLHEVMHKAKFGFHPEENNFHDRFFDALRATGLKADTTIGREQVSSTVGKYCF